MSYHPTENNIRLFRSRRYDVDSLLDWVERVSNVDITVRSNRQTYVGLLVNCALGKLTEQVEVPAGEIFLFESEAPWNNIIPELSNILSNTRDTGKSTPLTLSSDQNGKQDNMSSDVVQSFKEKLKELRRWLTADPMPLSMYNRRRIADRFSWN